MEEWNPQNRIWPHNASRPQSEPSLEPIIDTERGLNPEQRATLRSLERLLLVRTPKTAERLAATDDLSAYDIQKRLQELFTQAGVEEPERRQRIMKVMQDAHEARSAATPSYRMGNN